MRDSNIFNYHGANARTKVKSAEENFRKRPNSDSARVKLLEAQLEESKADAKDAENNRLSDEIWGF